MSQFHHQTSIIKDDLSTFLGQFNFEILHFGYWEKNCDSIDHNVFLSHYKCVIVEKGCCQLYFLGKKYTLQVNDCIIVPPFTFYTAQCDHHEDFAFYTFHFEVYPLHLQESFVQHFNLTSILFLHHLLHLEQYNYLKMLNTKVNQKEAGTYLFLRQAFILILLQILKADPYLIHMDSTVCHIASNEAYIVNESIEYIQQHLQENLKVNDLCVYHHISQSYLYKCFKNYLSISPSTFISQYKIKASFDLLKDSDESIASIAEKVGFSSVFLFSNTFKTITGFSPTHFRNHYREKA